MGQQNTNTIFRTITKTNGVDHPTIPKCHTIPKRSTTHRRSNTLPHPHPPIKCGRTLPRHIGQNINKTDERTAAVYKHHRRRSSRSCRPSPSPLRALQPPQPLPRQLEALPPPRGASHGCHPTRLPPFPPNTTQRGLTTTFRRENVKSSKQQQDEERKKSVQLTI